MVKPKGSSKKTAHGYLHGFTRDEQDRLYRQARFLEHRVHDRLPFRRCEHLIEVGCGVGAQTEILLRHFPELHVTGDRRVGDEPRRARRRTWRSCRGPTAATTFVTRDAGKLRLRRRTRFDSAFLCWILEHVADPMHVLSETRRVLRPGSPIVVHRGAERDVLPRSRTARTRSPTGGVQRPPARARRRSVRRREARQPAAGGRLPRHRHRGADDPPRQPRSGRARGVPRLLDRAPAVRRAAACASRQGLGRDGRRG